MTRCSRAVLVWIVLAAPASAQEANTDDAAEATPAAAPAAAQASDSASDLDETLITVWGDRPRRFDVIQGTNVLEGDALERDLSLTIGQTLERQAGIHNGYFGPGAGRPVIRGFDGNRVRVLNNGIGMLDASAASPDHNVAFEPLSVQRIEVLRGAGALRYGPSAIGGVVNVIDGRIPTVLPDGPVGLTLRSGYGSNADERFFGGGTTLGFGQFAFRGEGFFRTADDMTINGFNLSDDWIDQLIADGEEVEGFRHEVEGTDIDDNRGGSAGLSYIWDTGYAGFAYSRLRNNYGIIEAFHHEDDPGMMPPGMEEEEEGVRIDLEQDRYDIAAEWNREFWAFDQVAFRGAYVDYNHDEVEGAEVVSTFERYAWEGRLELQQKPLQLGGLDLSGLWGFQFETGNFRAIAEEAFLPRVDSLETGLFGLQQIPLGPVNFDVGLRWDYTNRDPRGITEGLIDAGFTDLDDETFNTISFSTGVSWSPDDNYLLGLSLARTERAPSEEELFSGGPHLATGGFEVGDPGLDEEAGIGLELTARKRLGRLTGGFNFYYTFFDDYIYLMDTGAEEDDLPVRQWSQDDAEIWGAEFELDLLAYEKDDVRGLFDLTFDYVNGELDGGDNLPRIAPWRIRIGGEAQSRFADLRLEVVYVGEQDETADFEFDTDDYAMFNASLAIRPFPNRHALSILLEGRNLTNEEAREHVSFLKDVLPLPGRDLRVTVRYDF